LPTELLHTVQVPLPASLRAAYQRWGADAAALPQGTVRLERGEQVDLAGYFAVALASLATHGPQVLLQELAVQKQDRVSGLVMRAIERSLCNRLALSPAVLAEVGRLNSAGISPDFLLTKADPQAVGFMVDLLGVVRQTLLPRLTGGAFSVLDLGAKSGAGSELMGYLGQSASFSKLKFGITCADIDPTFVDYCRAKHPHVEYLNADVFQAGRQWDIVLCSHVVEHVPNPIDFVRKLRLIARQYVVLAFPYVEDPAKLIPGHIHSLGHDFLRALGPSRYEIYDGMFWSQSLCCIAVIDVRP
jgi:SAM-dependent methyltransferase